MATLLARAATAAAPVTLAASATTAGAAPMHSGVQARSAVAVAGWIGSVLIAVDPAVHPFPESLDEFATTAAAARSYHAPLSAVTLRCAVRAALRWRGDERGAARPGPGPLVAVDRGARRRARRTH